MSVSSPFINEVQCDNCNEKFPESLVSEYVVPKRDKKSSIERQVTINACPLCIADLAGKRLGMKGPFDFSDDPEMTKKIAYATELRNTRSGVRKLTTPTTDEKSDEQRQAEEEAELQRQIDEEDRLKVEQQQEALDADEELTNMLEVDESTSLSNADSADDDDKDKPKGSRSGSRRNK